MPQARTKADKDAFEQRRQEVKQGLAAGGFGPTQLAFFGRRRPEGTGDNAIVRLRDVLEQLGPVFASFGLYLSSRPDLLSLPDCVALANITNRSCPSPADQIRQLVRAELNVEQEGTIPTQRFVKFDNEPFESRLVSQLHHGELDNGDLVVVKLIHPRVRQADDLKLLPLLTEAVTPQLSDPEQFGSLVDDFRHAFTEALDCRRVAESLQFLSHDTRETDKLTVPKVYQDLCTENILVTERLDGQRLDHYINRCRERLELELDSSGTVDGIVPDELARQLCDVWLRQAFDGTMLPIDVLPENILIRSPTEFAILDGTFLSLPRSSKENLLDYFIANATDEPSQALAGLLKELDAVNCRISESTLDRKFRQVVAFRDGGWEDGGRANCLSDTLFAQWQLAASNGYRPLRHLTQVYRGTFHVASLARQLSPQRDSLLEGVKDLRLTKLLHDISSMMQPGYWGGQADRLAALLVLGPRFLDDALKTVSDKSETQNQARAASRSNSISWNTLLLAFLTLIVVFLFREQFSTALTPAWSERFSAIAFLVVGSLIIRLLIRSADS